MWQLFLHLSDGYLLGMGLWLLALAACPAVMLRLRRRWRQSPGRIRLVMAIFSAWTVAGFLTVIELSFAFFYDTTDSFDMTNVSHRWFQVHVNPDVRILEFRDGTGLRYRDDQDFALNTSASRHICFLGDSFTFGHGVPNVRDRFSNRCRNELPESTSVSNLAWPGTDLLWHESVLQHVFESGGKIDDAVYVLCLNDIEAFHDPTMSRSTELSHFEPPTFLFRDTYFFNWLYFRSQLLTRPAVRGYYDFVNEYYQGEPFERMRSTLHRTSELCKQHGSRLSVVVFPFLHNLADETRFKSAHSRIAEACEQLSIPHLDLHTVLSKHANERLTVNPFDAHPNERAHELAADAILNGLFNREPNR